MQIVTSAVRVLVFAMALDVLGLSFRELDKDGQKRTIEVPRCWDPASLDFSNGSTAPSRSSVPSSVHGKTETRDAMLDWLAV